LGGDSIYRIHRGLEEAATYATESFRVIPSLNLLALFNPEVLAAARNQPRRCHMQALRQVVTPTGVYGCPAYRGDPRSLIAERDGYVSVAKYRGTAAQTAMQIERFDASKECRNITCLYNSTNWWLERFDSRERTAAISQQEEEIPIFL
jgi:hypothetical protein